jgi:hypothetical protein
MEWRRGRLAGEEDLKPLNMDKKKFCAKGKKSRRMF